MFSAAKKFFTNSQCISFVFIFCVPHSEEFVLVSKCAVPNDLSAKQLSIIVIHLEVL